MSENKAGDLSASLSLNQSGQWFVVRVEFQANFFLQMIPNPGYPRSVISAAARDDLIQRELVPPLEMTVYRLQNMTIQGQTIPDFDVEVRPFISRLKVDGMLGLDFFERYIEIRFEPVARRLTLIDP